MDLLGEGREEAEVLGFVCDVICFGVDVVADDGVFVLIGHCERLWVSGFAARLSNTRHDLVKWALGN